MAEILERLTAQLDAWLSLGGGSLQWPYAVRPEPPFVPFSRYRLRQQHPPDDGRRDRFLGRLIELSSLPREGSPFGQPTEFDWLESLEEPIADDRAVLYEITLRPPATGKITPAALECFLHALGAVQEPVTFEILATKSAVTIQLCVDERDVAQTQRSIETFLPEVETVSGSSLLADHFGVSSPHGISMVDIELEKWFPLPIGTGKNFIADPYQTLFNAMEGICSDEILVVQFFFESCQNDWNSSVEALVASQTGSREFSELQRELAKFTQAKLSRPLFATCIRIAAAGEDHSRRKKMLQPVIEAMSQFGANNTLAPSKTNECSNGNAIEDLVSRRFTSSGMILSIDELAGLVHLPGEEVICNRLVRPTERTAPAPISHSSGPVLHLGTNRHREIEKPVSLTIDQRTRHIHVLGSSGSGKSTFLLNCILQDLEEGHGLALLDPHGDLVEAVLDRLPENRKNDVVLFDPADIEFPLGFNILAAHSEIERNLLASDFVAIFERLSSSWGDQMTAVLGNAALALLESERGGTLLDLRRFLGQEGFRNEYLKSVRDPEVVYFWQHEFRLLKGNTQASLLTRLNGFLRQKLIRNMVAQDGHRFDVGRLMNEKKVVLAPLAQGLIGEENSWLLGSLLVSKFYQAALARQAIAEEERLPFWLYLDEAHRFLTPSIASILSGARKYGLGLTLAHQELDQFGRKDKAVLSSILTNASTRICFRPGDQDAKRLADGFDHFASDDLTQLSVGKAIARIGGSQHDFNLSCSDSPPKQANHAVIRQQATEHSRGSFATPRAELEAQLALSIPEPPPPKKSAATRARSGLDSSKMTSPSTPPVDPQGLQTGGASHGEQNPPQMDDSIRSDQDAPSSDAPHPELGKPQTEITDSQVAESIEASRSLESRPGRGGERHKELQQAIKSKALGLGLGGRIEKQLPDGASDVWTVGEHHRIAFEIALGSSIDQELKNITKSLNASCTRVVLVFDDPSHLSKVQEAVKAELPEIPIDKIRLLLASEIDGFFAEIASTLPTRRTQSRGYKVRTTFVKNQPNDSEST